MRRPLRTPRATALALALAAHASAQPAALAIRGTTVVDVEAGVLLPDQTVLVVGERIAAVGPVGELAVPEGARVVEGAETYLIPGLWDMHAHAVWPGGLTEAFFPALVAHGVTGIRDPWGDLTLARSLAAEVAAGRRVGPRAVVAGNLVDGPPVVHRGSDLAETPARGRALVDSLRRVGAAFIKVYHRLPREVYLAIADEARRLGVEFSGHVPFSVTAAEASDEGQRTVEHPHGVLEGCSDREGEILDVQRATLAALVRGDTTYPVPLRRLEARRLTVETFDPPTCRALLDRFARNGTWLVPTLTVIRSDASLADPAFRADPRLALVPPHWRFGWDPDPRLGPEHWRVQRAYLGRALELVALAQERGVGLLAGTDLLNPFVFPGSSLHDELGLLVSAGLTPADALRTATLNPARYLGAVDSLGTVAAGRLADLVLLEADPLADIANTRRIRAVVLNGRYLDRAALDGLLREAEEAAAGR